MPNDHRESMGTTSPKAGMGEAPRSLVSVAPSLVTRPGAIPVALYFTVGRNQVAPKSTRPPSSDMPAGLESTDAASRVAPTPTPPIEFWTGPKPIIRMPFVACAGVAASRAIAAARYDDL